MSHPQDDQLPILVFATHNANKVRELQEMLGDRYRIESLTDIGCHEEIVEDAPTLEGNAQIKARHVVTHYGLDCFADDTGLEVEALEGAPGVLSARYAGAHGDSEANMTKLLAELDRVGATSPEARSAQRRFASFATARSTSSKARAGAQSPYSGPGPKASATTPCSRPRATPAPLRTWPPRKRTRSATEAARSARWSRVCFIEFPGLVFQATNRIPVAGPKFDLT